MENLIKNKINLLIVLAIALLIVTGLFLYLQPKGQNPLASKKSITEQEFNLETKDTAPSVVLQGFPKDLPIEAGSKVLQSYESDSGNGRLQSTKKFTSSLTPQAALAKYVSFFESQDYVRTTTEPLTSPATLLKKDASVMVVINSGAENVTEVEITLLQNK